MTDVNGIELKNGMIVRWKRDDDKTFPLTSYARIINDCIDTNTNTIIVSVLKPYYDGDFIGESLPKFGRNLMALSEIDQFILSLELL